MKKISVTLITFNESTKVERALKSISPLADEIVVVDSFSTDETEEICRKYTDRFLKRVWPGYRDQKNFALGQATHEWVMSIDADEVVSQALLGELLVWKNSEAAHAGYLMPRRTFFMGRWIYHTTWYPDWQLRLFRKSKASWVGGRVHESIRVVGSVKRMENVIEHYTYSDISEYLAQLQNFTTLSARDYFDQGRRTHLSQLVLNPAVGFVRNYFLCRGFLDGVAGLVISCLAAVSVFFKFLKLWELQNSAKDKS